MLQVLEHRYDSVSQPRHAHAETTVTMILAGTLRERVGTDEEIGRPLSIVVKPRDTEHANDFGTGVRTLQIRLLGRAAADLEAWSSDIRRWRWQHAGAPVPRFMTLLRTVRSSKDDPSYADRVERAACDALASIEPCEMLQCGRPPRWLVVVRESLDDADHPPPVQALAKDADVHPVYLARQFRRWFGRSITEHLKRRRVQRAATAIATTSAALSVISYQSGFADQPHMTRVFASETGVTPGAYRALVRGKV